LIREAGAAAKAALQRQRLRCEGGGSGRDGRGAALSSSVETDASSPMVSSGRNKKTDENTCYFARAQSTTQKITKGDRQGNLKLIQRALTIVKY
jgi:stress response protein SCP2